MRVGFLFWPFTPELVRQLAASGTAMISSVSPTRLVTRWILGWPQRWWRRKRNVQASRFAFRTSLRGIQRYPPPQSPRSTCLRRVEQSLGSVLAIAARAIWGSRDPARANSPTAPISSAPYWRANRRLGEADKRISHGYASHPQSSSPHQDRGRSPQRAIVRTEFLSITAFW